jgi:hypothetical protein
MKPLSGFRFLPQFVSHILQEGKIRIDQDIKNVFAPVAFIIAESPQTFFNAMDGQFFILFCKILLGDEEIVFGIGLVQCTVFRLCLCSLEYLE